MNILSLDIKDLFSFENLHMDFQNNGLTLIEGWNFDDDRANGSGKSSIFNALSFCIYDKIPKKIAKKELVRFGKKSGSATVKISVNNNVYTVTRSRPNNVSFLKNGSSIDMTQEEFESLIKLSYDQFLITTYIYQRTSFASTKFIDLNDTSKKEFLLKLMNLEKLAKYKKVSDLKIKELTEKLSKINNNISNSNNIITTLNSYLIDVEEIKDKIKPIISSTKQLLENKEQYSKVKKPDVTKIEAVSKQINDKLSTFNSIHSRKGQILYQIQSYPTVSEHDKHCCPSCDTDLYIINEKIVSSQNVDDANKQFTQKKNKEIEELNSELDNINLQLQEEDKLKDLLIKIKDKYQSTVNEYNVAQNSISKIDNEIEHNKFTIQSFKDQVKNNDTTKNRIQDMHKEISQYTQEAEEINKEIEIYKTISHTYSATGIPAYIMDSLIDSFNEMVVKYINMLWPNTVYSINTFKEKTNGEITTKFSENLIKEGKERSIGSLSGGEYRAISIAIDFAIMDVIKNQFAIDINPVILDEPFDGLDSSGRDLVISLLHQVSVSRQILVVDHAQESKTFFSETIRVEKKNGISRLQ